jgi:hypothetical protein
MKLVGVRFTRRGADSDGEVPFAEFRLDPADSSKVEPILGQGTVLVDDIVERGIRTGPDARFAQEIGRRYGIDMPVDSRTFTFDDGSVFLVALLAVHKGGPYSGVYPLTA